MKVVVHTIRGFRGKDRAWSSWRLGRRGRQVWAGHLPSRMSRTRQLTGDARSEGPAGRQQRSCEPGIRSHVLPPLCQPAGRLPRSTMRPEQGKAPVPIFQRPSRMRNTSSTPAAEIDEIVRSFSASPINVSRLILGPRCGRGWQRHGRGDGSRSTPPSRQCKQAASAVDAVLRAYDRAERRKSRKFALRTTIRSFPSSFRTVCKGCSGSPP